MSDEELIAEVARLKAEGERIQADHEKAMAEIAAESEARCAQIAADCEAMERKLAAEVQRQQRDERRRLNTAFHLNSQGLRASPALMNRLCEGSPVRVDGGVIFADTSLPGLADFVIAVQGNEPDAGSFWLARYGPLEQTLERQQMRDAQRRLRGEAHDQ